MTMASPRFRRCAKCGCNRDRRFYSSPRGRVCKQCKRKKLRELQRAYRLRHVYELSAEDYDRILTHQGGLCAICKGKRPYQLDVDHDHATGLIRGLLCKRCNRRLLPAAKDDPAVLGQAILYLNTPTALAVLGRRYVPSASARDDG